MPDSNGEQFWYFTLSPSHTVAENPNPPPEYFEAKPNFKGVGHFFFELVGSALTWDQALFSFRFENNIPAGKVSSSR